jgi:hypothetical protein
LKKRIISNLVFLIILGTIVIMACNNNPVINNTYTVSGTVTFADTSNLITDTAVGFYTVDAFSTWFPTGSPNGFAVLNITKTGNVYSANYSIPGLSNGIYVITTAFLKKPYPAPNHILGLGLYGCDTSHSFSCLSNPPNKANIAGYNVTGINFLSLLDTTKQIYKF